MKKFFRKTSVSVVMLSAFALTWPNTATAKNSERDEMKTVLTNQWTFVKEKGAKKAINFELKKDRLDLDTLSEGKGKELDQATLTTEFELDQDQKLWFGFGCDWWCEITFNGEKVYSTFPGGNSTPIYNPKNHIFSVNGIKGKNKFSIKVKRGMASWMFCFKELSAAEADPEAPLPIELDPAETIGKLKVMNAVNNGPIRARADQTSGNFENWKKLEIPFARNHDAAFCSSYGGEHCVDVHLIFPDFNADPNDPASYDFTLTDRLIENTLAGGTKIFYRLGTKIEHNIKKYGTRVPPDFKKWAVICEHIISHYNEGWANGFHHNIIYWEIWNEADLSSNMPDKKTWQGTDEQFFEFYRTAACHLKKRFPKLKIGGPALAGRLDWMKLFLKSMTKAPVVPFDFFSWHIYTPHASAPAQMAIEVRNILDSFGYTKTESILNEWNYVRGWTSDFVYSLQTVAGLKGAVFTASVMCDCQNAPVDMLMYYDARPCGFNGIFSPYTYKPLKGFYTFLAWKQLNELKTQFKVNTAGKRGIYACGTSNGKKTRLLLTRYWEPDQLPGDLPVSIKLKKGSMMGAKLFLLDETHDLTEVPYFTGKDGSIRFSMAVNTLVLIEI